MSKSFQCLIGIGCGLFAGGWLVRDGWVAGGGLVVLAVCGLLRMRS